MKDHPQPVFIETILCVNGRVPLLNLHLERLAWGCWQVGVLPMSAFLNEISIRIMEAVPSSGTCKLRCLVSFQGQKPEVAIEISSMAFTNRVVNLGIFPNNLKGHGQSWNAKTTERKVYDQAMLFAQENGWDDALVLNVHGEVVDACIYNVFAVKGNVLFTPPLSSYPVKGVMREWVKRNAVFPVVDKILYLKDLAQADCILLTNAIRGIQLGRLVQY